MPQAVRTKVPVEYYSTTYITNQACEWLPGREDQDRPFFLMLSFPDPHHPFNPPGKYWDMYKPEDINPKGLHRRGLGHARLYPAGRRGPAEDPTLGQKMGYSLAVSAREAQEYALTCGMITMVDDARCAARRRIRQGWPTTWCRSSPQTTATTSATTACCSRALNSTTPSPMFPSSGGPKGATGTLSDELGQTLDIGTTIMEHARIEAPDGMRVSRCPWPVGVAGRRLSSSTKPSARRRPLARHRAPHHHRPLAAPLYRGKAQNELFDLDTDPDEMVNLWDHERFQEVKASLIEQLAELEIDVINSVPFPTSGLITGLTCPPRPLSVSSSLR